MEERTLTSTAGAESSSGGLNGTKTLGEAPFDANGVKSTLEQGRTLIDRFYNGGNRAKPEALDILVGVLDVVVRRMRQQYTNRQRDMSGWRDQIARIDAEIEQMASKQEKLQAELEAKSARADELKEDIASGISTVNNSIDIAKEALSRAKLATRTAMTKDASSSQQLERGYDKKGRALPGREKNLRRNPNGPAARKAGDMLKDLDGF